MNEQEFVAASPDSGSDTPVSTGSETVESTTEAPSASVEETTPSTTETSEKTETTQEVPEGGEEQEASQGSIPYDRFKEVNDRARAAEEKAKLFDELQKNPTLASTYLQNMPKQEEVSPELKQASDLLKGQGFITKEDVAQILEQQKAESETTRLVEETKGHFLSETDRLAKEYDGSNGMPKFDANEIAEYMDTHGFVTDDKGKPDVEKAFVMMNMDSFIDGQAKLKRRQPHTETKTQPNSSADMSSKADFKEAQRTGDFTKVIMDRMILPAKLRK